MRLLPPALNLAETKFYEVPVRLVLMLAASFTNFKSCALHVSPHSLGDRAMAHLEVRVRTQASHGNTIVLSHL